MTILKNKYSRMFQRSLLISLTIYIQFSIIQSVLVINAPAEKITPVKKIDKIEVKKK